MAKLRKVTGTWRGTYGYDPVGQLPARAPVQFALILEQGRFGHFTGTVTDDGPRGMPGTGYVEGYLSFPHIHFKKLMPVCCITTPDDRCITLREFVIDQGYKYERDIPHPIIYYAGAFSSANRAEGTWMIPAAAVSPGDGLTIQLLQAGGEWSIESVVH